jgi:dolichol kinase
MTYNLRKEISRKTIHFSSILIPLAFRYFANNDRKFAFLIIVPVTLLAILFELLRFYHPSFKKHFLNLFGDLMRSHEMDNISGATYLMVASVVCIAFFPVEITFVAIASLAIGDTLAAIVGINFGDRKFKGSKKSLEGSLACFIGTFIFAIFWVHPIIAFWGAIATAIAEVYPHNWDDNMKIPIISGAVMTFVNMFV